MNALTLGASFGVLVLVFQDGRLEGLLDYSSRGALDFTQPILIVAIVFALSTDYSVFLLSRIKEERDAGASDEEAVARGLERSGRIVTAAALLFCVAIGAFSTSRIVFIKELGVGIGAAVVVDATIVRAFLVPSLMGCSGAGTGGRRRRWRACGASARRTSAAPSRRPSARGARRTRRRRCPARCRGRAGRPRAGRPPAGS